jgi:hypothetical protein
MVVLDYNNLLQEHQHTMQAEAAQEIIETALEMHKVASVALAAEEMVDSFMEVADMIKMVLQERTALVAEAAEDQHLILVLEQKVEMEQL